MAGVAAGYDAHIAEELGRRWWARRPVVSEEATDTDAGAELPPTFNLELSRVQSLRYGENPHQAAALYRVSGADVAPGAFNPKRPLARLLLATRCWLRLRQS